MKASAIIKRKRKTNISTVQDEINEIERLLPQLGPGRCGSFERGILRVGALSSRENCRAFGRQNRSGGRRLGYSG
jgi:hypothetical protein